MNSDSDVIFSFFLNCIHYNYLYSYFFLFLLAIIDQIQNLKCVKYVQRVYKKCHINK
jgi:hypothetical protein